MEKEILKLNEKAWALYELSMAQAKQIELLTNGLIALHSLTNTLIERVNKLESTIAIFKRPTLHTDN